MPETPEPFHLSDEEVRQGMRASIWDGVLAGPLYNLILATGVFFTGLALELGADNFQIGLFAAAGPLMSGLSLIAARWLEHARSRKRIYLINAFWQRSLFLLLLAFPFLAGRLAPGSMPWVLLGLVVAATFFHMFQLIAWFSWMADMIPARKRGAFFSRRNLAAGFTWLALSYAAGLYLDKNSELQGYVNVFCIGSVGSLLALYFAARQPDPPMHVSAQRLSFKELWKSAYAQPAFKNFLLFQLVFGFTTNLAAPFFNVYMLKDLHIDISRVTLWTVIGGVLGTATVPYWGMLLDRAGAKATMLFALGGTVVMGFAWPFVGASNYGWLLPVILISGGFFNAGVGQAGFNMLLGVLPEQNKTSYIGLFQAVVGTLVGFSPALGGLLADGLGRLDSQMLPIEPVMGVIIVSAVLRLAPLFFVSSIPQQHDKGLGFLVEEFVFTNPFKLASELYYHFMDEGEKRG